MCAKNFCTVRKHLTVSRAPKVDMAKMTMRASSVTDKLNILIHLYVYCMFSRCVIYATAHRYHANCAVLGVFAHAMPGWVMIIKDTDNLDDIKQKVKDVKHALESAFCDFCERYDTQKAGVVCEGIARSACDAHSGADAVSDGHVDGYVREDGPKPQENHVEHAWRKLGKDMFRSVVLLDDEGKNPECSPCNRTCSHNDAVHTDSADLSTALDSGVVQNVDEAIKTLQHAIKVGRESEI